MSDKYDIAAIIGNKLYDTTCSVVSGVWCITKFTVIETTKLAVPTLITLAIARKTGMLDDIDINIRKTITVRRSSFN